MKKFDIDSADLLFMIYSWSMIGLLGAAVLFGIDEFIERKVYSNKHDNFRPMPELSQDEEAAVYNIGDSMLTARKARFDALVQDYNNTMDEVNIKYRGILPVHESFKKIYVKSKYANKIGVENIRQYSKYLDRYEQDSLAPVYRDVYQHKFLPTARNGVRSK